MWKCVHYANDFNILIDYYFHSLSTHVQCSQCEQSYAIKSKQNFETHVETKHDKVGGWKCKFCQKAYNKLHMLRGHMRTAHEISQSRQQIAACWDSHRAAAASSPVRHAAKTAAVEISSYDSLKIVKNANCQHFPDQSFGITQHTLIYTLYIILFQNKNISCQVPFKFDTLNVSLDELSTMYNVLDLFSVQKCP